MRLANSIRLLFWTPGPVPFRTCICSNVETSLWWTCHVSRLWISNIPRYFYFALLCWEMRLPPFIQCWYVHFRFQLGEKRQQFVELHSMQAKLSYLNMQLNNAGVWNSAWSRTVWMTAGTFQDIKWKLMLLYLHLSKIRGIWLFDCLPIFSSIIVFLLHWRCKWWYSNQIELKVHKRDYHM